MILIKNRRPLLMCDCSSYLERKVNQNYPIIPIKNQKPFSRKKQKRIKNLFVERLLLQIGKKKGNPLLESAELQLNQTYPII